MIKCYFVDVRSIKSEVPRSNFIESDLEKIADSILEMEGLIRPLILQEISFEKYTVIEGHQEYYAAVIAKEKNISKAEMVNAFIIQSNARLAAIEQLNLLRQPLPRSSYINRGTVFNYRSIITINISSHLYSIRANCLATCRAKANLRYN
jgi:hypothetical protein